MSSYLIKALAYEGQFRAYAIDATEAVAEAQKGMIHGVPLLQLWAAQWWGLCCWLRLD